MLGAIVLDYRLELAHIGGIVLDSGWQIETVLQDYILNRIKNRE
jgi:hypothetical protein